MRFRNLFFVAILVVAVKVTAVSLEKDCRHLLCVSSHHLCKL